MLYKMIDGKLKPYLSESGRKYKPRSKDQKHYDTDKMKRKTYYKFYNSNRWHQLANFVRKRDPICKICEREYHDGKRPLEKVNLSQSVDHIVPLKKDWSRRFDPSNLEGLCWSCHRKKDQNLHNR